MNTTGLRLYTNDMDFFTNYLEWLAQDAAGGLKEATQRMCEHVPRFHAASLQAIVAGKPVADDARQVVAAEHGFNDWSAMVANSTAITRGDLEDPYIDFIHKVEDGDIAAVTAHLDRLPSLVNEIASTHKAPLHSVGNPETAALLLERGADPTLETPLAGGTALMHALTWGATDVAEVIAAQSKEPANLRVAAALGELEMLDAMWSPSGKLTDAASAKRDYYRPNYGWYPWVPGDSHQELLDEALIYAAVNGRVSSAERLVERGAAVNGCAYNTTPLLRATWRGQTDMVAWLLDHGADLQQKGWLGGHAKGATALHLAGGNGDKEMIEFLLKRGADPTSTDDLYSATPAGWARNFDYPEAAGYLEAASRLK